MTDWNDKEQNPDGINFSADQPKDVQVRLTVHAQAYFTDKKGNKFVCVLIEGKRRVFLFSGSGYDKEVKKDEGAYFIVTKWTEEFLAEHLPKPGH
jgi:hypothetical protein